MENDAGKRKKETNWYNNKRNIQSHEHHLHISEPEYENDINFYSMLEENDSRYQINFNLPNLELILQQPDTINSYFKMEQIGESDGDEDISLLFPNYQCTTGIILTEEEMGEQMYISRSAFKRSFDFERFYHNMKIIGNIISVMSILITTRNLKTWKLIYYLITAVISVLTYDGMILSYRSLYVTLGNFISKTCLPVSHLVDIDEEKYLSKIRNDGKSMSITNQPSCTKFEVKDIFFCKKLKYRSDSRYGSHHYTQCFLYSIILIFI